MISDLHLPAIRPRRGCLRMATVVRLSLAIVAVAIVAMPALAAPALRGEVLAKADVVTLADLVEGAPADLAATPLFRAPALGETGTIQVHRIVDAAARLGVEIDAAGRGQVVVARAARRIGAPEIETAIRRAIEARYELDGRDLSIVFDGGAPSLLVAPDETGPVTAIETSYDPRTRRVSALVRTGGEAARGGAGLRVSGAVVEMVEVALLNRTVERGEAVRPADFVVERRARDSVPADARIEGLNVEGQVTRRTLAAGSFLRANDLVRPELVARGDIVTVVYQARGIMLTLRAQANEGGALGDPVTVVNPSSKRVLQAVVTGPGRVSVGAPVPGPVASAAPRRQ